MENSKLEILLAEDDKNLGSILKNYLIAKGYQTELFVNGQLAWEAFEKKTYTFCIVDVMMPVMDGFTLGKKIREKNKDKKIREKNKDVPLPLTRIRPFLRLVIWNLIITARC